MIIKPRGIPKNLQVRRLLKARMSFTDEELRKYLIDEKGYKGECYFDELVAQSPASTYLQLNDLYLEWHNSPLQIDSLLISPFKIFPIDVKNHEGECYIEGERWFYASGKEMKNPLYQLHRCESLFTPLIQSLGVNLPIDASLVFVNPEFTLFQANRNLPIILSTQVNSFLKKQSSVSMKSYPLLIEVAKKLASLHIEDTPYSKAHIPSYTYESVKKGQSCFDCGSLSVRLCGRHLICDRCDYKENLHIGIMRAVEEFRLLFPERLITVSAINEWTGLNIDRRRLQKILRDHFKMVGVGKTAYYL